MREKERDKMVRNRLSQSRDTTGQRPNESQKVVIIDMMKSVVKIASNMWPVI